MAVAEEGGLPDNRSSAEGKGRERESCAICEALRHTVPPQHTACRHSATVTEVYNCCFVSLFCTRARGGDDLSLFVGISGSVMWL